MKGSVCALVSGGLDSCAMLAGLSRRYAEVFPLFIRQGLVWESVELQSLKKFLRTASIPRVQPLSVLELPMRDVYGKHWSTTGHHTPRGSTPDEAVYLPGRNLLLLSKAAVFCVEKRIGTIAVGSLNHNPFPDATPTFFRSVAAIAGRALNFKLRIIAPLRRLTKEQVIGRANVLPLRLSFSCLAPRDNKHCGRCNKCVERRRAFARAGVEDNTTYFSP